MLRGEITHIFFKINGKSNEKQIKNNNGAQSPIK
jgi:hypothetical protein